MFVFCVSEVVLKPVEVKFEFVYLSGIMTILWIAISSKMIATFDYILAFSSFHSLRQSTSAANSCFRERKSSGFIAISWWGHRYCSGLSVTLSKGILSFFLRNCLQWQQSRAKFLSLSVQSSNEADLWKFSAKSPSKFVLTWCSCSST